MKNYGFIRVAAATPIVKVASVESNVKEICALIDKAEADEVSLEVFPELCVTGYTCADLFGQTLLIEAAERGVAQIARHTRGLRLTVVVGAPVPYGNKLYNCAVVIRGGYVKGIVPKVYLPAYSEFYELRWFSSGTDFVSATNVPSGKIHDDGKAFFPEGMRTVASYAGFCIAISPNLLFKAGEALFAVEICEDVWTPIPCSSYHTLAGAQIVLNLSASNDVLMKHEYRRSLVSNQSARTISGYVYACCGFGESTQDMVFAGSSLIYENGTLMAENKRFRTEASLIEADIDVEKLMALRRKETSFTVEAPDGSKGSDYLRHYAVLDLGPLRKTDFSARLLRQIEPHPFVPEGDPAETDRRAQELTSIQVLGLATRLAHIGCSHVVIGISGGLDSTLALIVTCMAFDRLGLPRSGILGVTMPGFGTSGRTYSNAVDLIRALGVTLHEISIVPAVRQHFADIGLNPDLHDVTYENSQARERTQILMDMANKVNGIVVGTGDLSELALGWATYNGDHMSMYGVNAGIPKTLVKYIVTWAAINGVDAPSDSVAGAASGDSPVSACGTAGTAGGRSAREILLDIADTPISPELIPADARGEIAQNTEDLVGPYELHDFFLYNFSRFGYSPAKIYFLACKAFLGGKNADGAVAGGQFACSDRQETNAGKHDCTDGQEVAAVQCDCTDAVRPTGKAVAAGQSACGDPAGSTFAGPGGKANVYTEEIIKKWLKVFYRRFFSQQFKRSCLPDGPKAGSVALSPRGDWRMPSDAGAELFLDE